MKKQSLLLLLFVAFGSFVGAQTPAVSAPLIESDPKNQITPAPASEPASRNTATKPATGQPARTSNRTSTTPPQKKQQTETGTIKTAPQPTAQWHSVAGQAHDVGVGANGTAWVIGWVSVPGGYNIARWNGSFWEDIPGGAVRIDVDPNGNAWIVNDAGLIFRWDGQTWQGIGGQAHDIGIGANGKVWVIGWTAVSGGYNIARWNGSFWEDIPGGAVRIDVDPNGNAWITNDTGLIFRWKGQEWDFSIGGQAHDVGIGADGTVWVIGWTAVPGGFNIGRWTGSYWADVEGGLNNISGAPNGSAWGTNTDGIIWKWLP
ncbi:MAG: hypothetical protein ACKVU2_08090 [Saprospiraceae bacterium]